jgi:branched-chain amino acid transport system permease protein
VSQEGSASFLKKRSKKPLLTGGLDPEGASARKEQKFFASFFQKRSASLHLGELLSTTLLIGLLITAPLFASRATVNDLGQAVCLGLFAISFNIIFKYSGLLSFGHAAFFGFAAYAAALLLQQFGNLPIPLLVLAAAVGAALLGLGLGHICVRRQGAYFSMTTLAIGAFFYSAAFKWSSVTGGTDGLDGFMPDSLTILPGWQWDSPGLSQTYWLVLAILIPAALAAWALLELTPFGNAVRAVRQNETRAKFLGYNTHVIKLANFTLAAGLAGVAGALWAIDNAFVSTDSIDLTFSTTVIIMAFLGGSVWYWGPVIGAVLYIAASDWLSAVTPHWQIWFGLAFILMVLFAPGGICGLVAASWRRFGLP